MTGSIGKIPVISISLFGSYITSCSGIRFPILAYIPTLASADIRDANYNRKDPKF